MKNVVEEYCLELQNMLTAAAGETEALERAAEVISKAYLAGKTIYVFGCTHSAILAEDVFYRAATPAFWRPLWGPGMSITTTPGILTSAAEHNEQLGRDIIRCSRAEAGDVIVVLSTSGKNAAPIAVAEEALARGLSLIVISSAHYLGQKGNHSRYANLWAFSDRAVMIDNHVPCGDSSIEVASCPMGPVSTVVGSFLMHSLSALAVEKIAAAGVVPPVFKSSNAPGGLEHNTALMERPELRESYLLP